MKLAVEFYGLDKNKDDYKLGTLIFDGTKFIWKEVAYEGVKEYSNEPIFVKDELIDPKKTPKKFMKNLYKYYNSTYVRTSKAYNVS